MKLTVDINVSERAIQAKVESLLDDETMLKINQLFADMCDPYVPFKTGALADVTVTPQGVKYTVPYAKKQYYGEFQHNLAVHPLATSFWDRVMLDEHYDEFMMGVREILIGRAKELYG